MSEGVGTSLETHPFQTFWNWLQLHLNCVLRAGSASAIVFDDDDLHWHFGIEDDDTYLVQVIRGKRIQAELVLHPSEVAYVQARPGDRSDEFLFELVPPTADAEPIFHFVMSHGLEADEAESGAGARWTH
ncbi:MAG: hypothetical protein P1V51_09695 [Deltaproteobacteria bacterium]|nr:hypothetical protein [Deltaproteobacteria bacterium]